MRIGTRKQVVRIESRKQEAAGREEFYTESLFAEPTPFKMKLAYPIHWPLALINASIR